MSPQFKPDRLELTGLRNIVKALKMKHPPVIKVGVIGIKATGMHAKGRSTNAEIGAAHEYGAPSKGLPVRSFLRVPLRDHLEDEMKQAKGLLERALLKVHWAGNIRPWLEVVRVVAKNTVIKAFDTAGFGKWKPSNMKRKKVHQTLVETQQLMHSIDTEVVQK